MSKEIATTTGNDVAIPDELTSFFDTETNDMDTDDLAIPRLRVIQSLSPQLDKMKPDLYLKDAEVGQIFDNVEKKVYDGEKGIILFICKYICVFVEWKPKRAGIVTVHDKQTGQTLLADCTKNDKGEDILPNGNILQKTAEYACVHLNEETGELKQCILNLKSTQLKKSKELNTMMDTWRVNGKKPPCFLRGYRFTTVPESNDQGNWMGWKIQADKMVNEYENGLAIAEICKQTRTSYENATMNIENHEGDDGLKSADIDEEAPY